MRLESKLNIVQEYRGRYLWLIAVVLLVFGFLIFWLAHLQILEGERYLALSEGNFVQERVLMPLRGRILDADGVCLAENRPAYNVYVTPSLTKDFNSILMKLEGYLNLSNEESLGIQRDFEKARGLLRFREILVKSDITREQLAILESAKLSLQGVTIRPGPRRSYPLGELTSHAIGYVGRISERELKKNPDYLRNDFIGKRGIELAFEEALHGEYGFEQVVVDAMGRVKSKKESEFFIKGQEKKPAIPGHNIVLSLDLDLQHAADEAFHHRAGSVVAMNVNTGFIKVWLSRPGFDANKFAAGISHSDWERYRQSILDPLMDKVAQASYFPGSTYKVIPALAALRTGKISPQSKTYCTGGYKLGTHTFHCWNRGGHGYVNLHRGIQQSCDTYFYWLADKIGHVPIFKLANQMGLGQKPGIGINNETTGRMPTEAWHRKVYKRKWHKGDTLSHVIGQGDLKVSPLQLALVYAVIANGGKLPIPQLVKEIQNVNGETLHEFGARIKRQIEFDKDHLERVQKGLFDVVNVPGGTGYLSRLIKPHFSGKTGTAQVASITKEKRSYDKYILKDHAWFVGYAPSENPEIVVVAMGEHGEHGSWVAPVVRDVIAAWWEKKTGEKAEYTPWVWNPPIKKDDLDIEQ